MTVWRMCFVCWIPRATNTNIHCKNMLPKNPTYALIQYMLIAFHSYCCTPHGRPFDGWNMKQCDCANKVVLTCTVSVRTGFLRKIVTSVYGYKEDKVSQTICNTYCFSTTIVMRTHLNITFKPTLHVLFTNERKCRLTKCCDTPSF
jgi:hypothetical protein